MDNDITEKKVEQSPKVETAQKEQSPQEDVIKSSANSVNRAVKEAENDQKEAAEIDLDVNPKKDKSNAVEQKQEATAETLGVHDTTHKQEVKEGEYKGEKTSGEGISDQEEKTVESPQKKTVEKKTGENEEEQNQLIDKGQQKDDLDGEKASKITALGEQHDNSLGAGVQAKNKDDLQPTHFIGTQKRALMENGQQVVELNIDKEAWLKAKPDKDGMLKVSLYDPKSTSKDAFSNTVLMISQDKVKSLQPDENGRLKLIVAEDQVGTKKPKIEVFEDNEINRARIQAKNPNPLGDSPQLAKERMLDKPLEHGFYGYKMDISMRDVKNQMPQDKQLAIDKMSDKELEKVIKDPKNQYEYTRYEEKLEQKQLEKFKSGSEIEIGGHVVGTEKGIEKIKFQEEKVNPANGEKTIIAKNEEGKEFKLSEDDVKKGHLTAQEQKEIKTETLKEVGKEINTSPNLKQEQKEAMETKVGKESVYKDYVDNMTPADKAEVNKKSGEEIKDGIRENERTLKDNEKAVKEGKTVTSGGEKAEKPDPAKELSKAIYTGKKEDVDNLLSSGVKVQDSHLKLMKEMKDEGLSIDPRIETAVKAAIPEPSNKMRM